MNKPYPKKVLPVSLLVNGRSCLVVGGGKVACRKINSLNEAGARITVVCPEIHPDLQELISAEQVLHFSRIFEDADITDMFLVFAATNDRSVNHAIVQLCQAHGILCCAVDANWRSADFVSPAAVHKDGLTIAVSTGGRSCRRSRMVKENLAKHIDVVGSADLIVIGTSHHCLHIDKREPFHLSGERMDQAGAMISLIWGVHEFMLLNTCNRFELIAVVSRQDNLDTLLKQILSFDHLDEDEFYLKRGKDAFAHVALVTAGLRSQTPGENNIVAQVKESLNLAVSNDWSAGMMQEWISAALHISKDIRQKTGPFLSANEIEDLCFEFLTARCKELTGKRILVIGSGVVGQGLIQRSLEHGAECDWCYHVNKPDIPPEWKSKIQLYTFNGLRDHLAEADVVVCAAASPGYVLHRGHAPFIDQEKNVVIVDLAMPRNVEPALDSLASNLHVADLDDLKRWNKRENIDMQKLYDIGMRIIDDHTSKYNKIINHFQGSQTDFSAGPNL